MFKQMSANFAWFMVVLGGVVECFWVSGLKHSSEIWHYVLTIIGVYISFACMLKACEKLEVSIVYSVFVGIGTVGVVLNEMLIFNEPVSIIKIILIAILLLSVIGLKFASKES
ncbi:multidrug efflux SMR transporter [Campylobacter insulaenigrae]|uniref:Multidrug efflux system protein, EmrE family n=1 Tax=Campylobacter insulaenigrae NCTC 12927 TaxID=1031564 RepID=A0A0A8H2C4_9BACT|nr:multidrug efflux SMR transporter [Campylobacter insulaenigrae]AJC88293.1 multidrug efflux system protein, EmrE family [Campylobacter insulaenigrae NCTC 12927]MCR6570963.1 multidrug efflux SMR transporter [Campylobacter insulaenigrae]MCR6572617.1 multidrug efflux SMR transporter [Campylobacter insulaenigrae]MCR6573897.1 multidrug efflux SMR transporter [Campylobacter insulaenigrae]MCR6575709.1 multidrug efflux SMR transporter [Campylobacter insulaenigrae]